MTDLNPQPKAWPQCSECKAAYVLRRAILFKTSGQTMEVGDQWTEVTGDPEEQDNADLPPGAVKWTAEREAFLREMLGAMAKLDAKLVDLFRGDPEQLGDRLDTVASLDATRMLSAGDSDMSYDSGDR